MNNLEFKPMLSPKKMIHKGIFGGTYFNKLIKINSKIRLWKMYKPKKIICTNSDPKKRETIYSILPSNFNFSKRFPGDNFLPLIVIGSPFLNPMFTIVYLLGDFSGEIVLWKINSGAEFFGFSKIFPSVDV